MRESDVPGLLRLVGTVFAEFGCVLRAELDEPHLLDPGRFFRPGGGEFWVTPPFGPILGTVAVKLHRGGAAELKCLYVHPGCRGAGWGRALTELALAHARRAGRRRIVLWSDTRFLAAHALYRRLGFEQAGLRPLHDSNRSWEYGFSRRL
ncbi:MAG: GNAT family N-acetyltransferase [Phycisphaerae bacterium]|nr:GNAT family N-acetyltransferase [Phycisphaerae bacterium]MCZ2399163.1 GNAT family N-acetyltransferase [Phycisphaerae bacterium]NUQ49472.1 GNAT family N-acetyltransferase [Phycisphaerae bacterium]